MAPLLRSEEEGPVSEFAIFLTLPLQQFGKATVSPSLLMQYERHTNFALGSSTYELAQNSF